MKSKCVNDGAEKTYVLPDYLRRKMDPRSDRP